MANGMRKEEIKLGLRVLSLFDGIACGMQAFKELEIPIDVYYASEIEENAIKIAKANHPEIIEIGDVTKINFEDYVGKVDIIIGGSPCQGFSVCGKQLAFLDERSALIEYFFEAVDTIKPKYFFLENVVMQKQYERNISDILGVDAIRIDAALVSVQQRIRLYWMNIPNVEKPKQIYGLNIKNVIGEKYSQPTFPEGEFRITHQHKCIECSNHCLMIGTTGDKNSQSSRVYSSNGKINTITLRPHNRYMLNGEIKTLTIEGCEICQGLPIGYTKYIGEGGRQKRWVVLGNAWCVPVIKHIFSFIPKEDYENARTKD